MEDVMAGNDIHESTMGEKLASLNIVSGGSKSGGPEDPPHSVTLPSADSVHVLLKQALHADDHSLLLECLYNTDEKVIAKSISLLNPADVLKLLKWFISMMHSRGTVMVRILPWLRSLLCQKVSSIVSQESSLQLLNSLYQLIDSRVSTHKSAVQLCASLDVLFSGIHDKEAADGEEEVFEPIIYEDKDSDEDELDNIAEDGMEMDDNAELGEVDDAHFSDASDIMSD